MWSRRREYAQLCALLITSQVVADSIRHQSLVGPRRSLSLRDADPRQHLAAAAAPAPWMRGGAEIADRVNGVTKLSSVVTKASENWVAFTERPAFAQFASEAIGTGLVVLFGIGVKCSADYTQAQMAMHHMALMWGLAYAIATHVSSPMSGGHLNPAITVARAALGYFPWGKVPIYIAGQLLGAVAGSAINMATFAKSIQKMEKERNWIRGTPASSGSQTPFGMYFNKDRTTAWGCLCNELWTTAVLTYVVFAVTDPYNRENDKTSSRIMNPLLVGATVAALMSVVTPINFGGFNPARDLGSRLVSYLAGWRGVAMRFWWCFTIGPLIGGLLGGWLYKVTMGNYFAIHHKDMSEEFGNSPGLQRSGGGLMTRTNKILPLFSVILIIADRLGNRQAQSSTFYPPPTSVNLDAAAAFIGGGTGSLFGAQIGARIGTFGGAGLGTIIGACVGTVVGACVGTFEWPVDTKVRTVSSSSSSE